MKNILLAFALMLVVTVAHAATTSSIEPSFNTALCIGGGQTTYTVSCPNNYIFTLSGSYYTISPSTNSSLCLDAGQGSVTSFGVVQQNPCVPGQTSQQWQVVLNANNTYSLLTYTGAGQIMASGTYAGAGVVSGPAGTGLIPLNQQQFSLPGFGSSSPAPTVSLSASPTSVASGGSATLTWSSTNATSRSASNGWSGAQATSGTQALNNLTATATYTLTCTGAGGSANQSVTVTVTAAPPPPVPTVSLSANPTSVASGGSATLTWSSTNATSCTASNGWSGAEATSGTQSLNNLTATTTYTLTCTGAGGSANQSVTVTVVPPPAGGTTSGIEPSFNTALC